MTDEEKDVIFDLMQKILRKSGDKGVYKYSLREFLYRPGTRKVSEQKELIEIVDMIRNNIIK